MLYIDLNFTELLMYNCFKSALITYARKFNKEKSFQGKFPFFANLSEISPSFCYCLLPETHLLQNLSISLASEFPAADYTQHCENKFVGISVRSYVWMCVFTNQVRSQAAQPACKIFLTEIITYTRLCASNKVKPFIRHSLNNHEVTSC